MPPVSGSTIVAPQQGTVLVEQTFPSPRTVRLTTLISATYPFDALLEVWNGQGQVVWDVVLPINPPLWVSPQMGPINVERNGRIRVVSRDTPAVTPAPLEVQATLQITDWGER